MFEIKGKYNTAEVFTDNCDKETISQITTLLNQESTKDNKIRIMPDCHAGKGCVIGTTMTITDKVIPNLVGVDIGCGVMVTKLKEKRVDLPNLDSVIRKYVPSGFDIHDKARVDSDDFDLSDLKCYGKAAIKDEYIYRSIGSLGGGNHFIEVDKDKDGNLYLVIHTGSRNLGKVVCDYYQDLGFNSLKFVDKSNCNIIIDKLKVEGREQDIETELKKFKAELNKNIPHELAYVSGKDFEDYISDMKWSQYYAKRNRQEITKIILKNAKLHGVESFDTIHNYIDTDNMILRKGSISAQKDEIMIIPMNMRDGSLICVGKGNPEWNYSAPHGAGRILSRSSTKESISMKEYKESMTGIYTSCINTSTIDESPMAYKPMDEIVECIKDTVDIIDIIKPIYNFKAN